MSPTREIYLLSPRRLSPETIAVTFAKTSRSPLSFRDIAAQLTDEHSAKFHEKWVVGYGHASVAEHAVLHIAFENVSRLAIESIESNRLASYTEKSTRYQTWSPDSFYRPQALLSSPHAEHYQSTCARLFEVYEQVLPPLHELVKHKHPRRNDETERSWNSRIRTKYVDVARYLLPAASLANVGMTANARSLEHSIRKMLSHPLQEVREIGQETRAVALRETPTLVKYADEVPYMLKTEAGLKCIAEENFTTRGDSDWLQLVDCDRQGEDKFLAACLYRVGGGSLTDALQVVHSMSQTQRAALAEAALGCLNRFDIPLRELEHVTYTCDALMDQGAYFEFKRHRMMTQTPQRLTAELGYARPRMFEEAGLLLTYDLAMTLAAETYSAIATDFPEEAAYVVPNGYNRRLLMTFNLREAFHFCELRSAPNAHFAVRRLARRMYELICTVHPTLGKFMRWEDRPEWRAIDNEHFSQAPPHRQDA